MSTRPCNVFRSGSELNRRERGRAGCPLDHPWLEALEARRFLYSATLDASGILTVVGSAFGDHITLHRAPGREYLDVEAYGSWDGARLQAGFSCSQVKGIVVLGGDGDDFIRVWGDFKGQYTMDDYQGDDTVYDVDIPITLKGEAGDDELNCASSGDDVQIGGPGFDRAYAIAGHDLFSVEILENQRNGDTDYPDRLGWTPENVLVPDPWDPDPLAPPAAPPAAVAPRPPLPEAPPPVPVEVAPVAPVTKRPARPVVTPTVLPPSPVAVPSLPPVFAQAPVIEPGTHPWDEVG